MLKWIIIGVYAGIMVGLLSCQSNPQNKMVKDNQQKVVQSQSIERRDTMSTFSQTKVSVSFIIKDIRDDKLEAEYSFTNHSESDVYIFNQLFDRDLMGHATINPNRIYGFIEDDNTIVLAKKAIAIPKGICVEYPEVPYVSLVPAGRIFSEKITLPLPFKLSHPYMDSPVSGQVKNFKHIRFELGILPASTDLHLHEGTLQDKKKYLRSPYGQSLQRQIILSSEKLDVSIPVIVK